MHSASKREVTSLSKVRVIALNADGTGCVILGIPAPAPEDQRTEEERFQVGYDLAVIATPELANKPYLDMDPSQLPDPSKQRLWKLKDGRIDVPS